MLSVACASAATLETETPLPTPSPAAVATPSEEALKEVVIDSARALAKGNSAVVYSYFSAGYQSKCPFDNFAGNVLLAQVFRFAGIADREVGYEITDIASEGDRYYVTGTLTVDGRPLPLLGGQNANTYATYWEWADGKWWRSTDDEDPCPSPAS